MIRNTADVDDRRRFTYDLHAVLWRSGPATLWSVANPPFNQRYIYQPFFENRSPSTTSRDLVTLLDYFLGKRHSTLLEMSDANQNTVSIPMINRSVLRAVLSTQAKIIYYFRPPTWTQFDSNCKHHGYYFDSYSNLHFTIFLIVAIAFPFGSLSILRQVRAIFDVYLFVETWNEISIFNQILQSTFYSSYIRFSPIFVSRRIFSIGVLNFRSFVYRKLFQEWLKN